MVIVGAEDHILVLKPRIRSFQDAGHVLGGGAALLHGNIDPRGGAYYWNSYVPGEHQDDEDGDVSAIRSGYISVTPLHLDLTHEATRRKLAHQFEKA